MLALTMGDPSGIGGEITAAAWRAGAPPFLALADPDWLAGYGAPVRVVADPAEAARAYRDALPVLPVPLAIVPGAGGPRAVPPAPSPAARAEVGPLNKMPRHDRHDRGIYSDRAVARRLSAAFGTMNRRRGHVSRARKAVAAAEAALLALAN